MITITKKLFITLLILLITVPVYSAPPTRSYSYTSGTTINPDHVTTNEDNMFLYLQAGVDTYTAGSLTGAAMSNSIAKSTTGNWTFGGTTNLSGTWQINGTTITATAASLNNVGATTASSAELNILDGATLSTAELNFSDGLSGDIQTQFSNHLDGTTPFTSINVDGGSIVGITDLAIADGGTNASDAATARSNLSAAKSGANSDITSLSGLTTDITVAQGGTGAGVAVTGLKNLGGEGMELFTSSGTFTVPAGITTVFVTMVAGGGGGAGGAGGSGGGGGGAGEAFVKRLHTVTPAAGLTVTIGAKGTGGAADTDGTDGGDTVFDTITADKGAKGLRNNGAGGTGGGSASRDGSGATKGSFGEKGGDGADGVGGVGGGGGASYFGDGGQAGNGGGDPGTGYGSGGGGAWTSGSGGDGTAGFVLVEY